MGQFSKRSSLLSVLAAVASAGAAMAQQIPIDNFADGDDNGWQHWVSNPAYPGFFNASSGCYQIGTVGLVPANAFTVVLSQWENSLLPACSQGTLHVVVRATSAFSNPGLVMRWNEETLTGYAFVADSANGNLVIIRTNGNVAGQPILASAASSFRLNQDWHFEASTVGPQLSFKAWRVGTTEPEPQIVFLEKEPIIAGGFSLAVAHPSPSAASRISACFDDVVFTPACHADVNLDGILSSQDFFDFITAFFKSDPAADFNSDGTITSQDFFDFIAAFFAGC